ncbi:MAG: hypothetical protein K8I60_18090 [Anaerolineae bacterium]|nr:hypothetical protein [Anaerolineae bacterium]
MQHLNTLWQAISAASAVTDLARHSQTFTFGVSGPVTFYLRAEQAEVRVIRWIKPHIEVIAQLQAAFGWRVATDQDEAGVYVAARRRPLVGGLSRAVFEVRVPPPTYLILNVEGGRVVLENTDGTLHIPPAESDGTSRITPAGRQ